MKSQQRNLRFNGVKGNAKLSSMISPGERLLMQPGTFNRAKYLHFECIRNPDSLSYISKTSVIASQHMVLILQRRAKFTLEILTE